MWLQQVKERYLDIPKPIRSFLISAVILFFAWKLLYNLVLLPVRIPDAFLTSISTAGASVVLHFLYPNLPVLHYLQLNTGAPMEAIVVNGVKSVAVGDGCNGLELYVLYLGFLICRPGTLKTRIGFALTGIVTIYILNIIRIAGLSWLYLHHSHYVNFAHKYLFKGIVYFFVYLLWNEYLKINKAKEKAAEIFV